MMMNTMRFKANSKLAMTQKKKKTKYEFDNVKNTLSAEFSSLPSQNSAEDLKLAPNSKIKIPNNIYYK